MTHTDDAAPRWIPVAREVFEYQMVPWIGREYAAWLRTSARPHPSDPHRLVLVPERIYRVFQDRQPGGRVTPAHLESMHYPRLPDEDELHAAVEEQRLATLHGDEQRLRELHGRIEGLQEQLEAARRAVETWRRADPELLEERIAWELANAPHADTLVGIPAEAQRA
jgi:hypothetical protein